MNDARTIHLPFAELTLAIIAGLVMIVWPFPPMVDEASAEQGQRETFREELQPLFQKFCHRCHNGEIMKSGVRVDQLTEEFPDGQLFLWRDILHQLEDETMPPEDEIKPSAEQRAAWARMIRQAITAAQVRNQQANGSIRRLTVSQYRHTLRDLLGLDEDLTEILPPDGLSKDGFVNNGQVMVLSPLQMEYYFEIAEKALDLCIVEETTRPVVQNFRVELGTSINSAPCPDALTLGADSHLLNNDDFRVTELAPARAFDYQPFRMRTAYEFIEGYEGNATVRGWRKYDSIYHAVFACLRGTQGYPKGLAYQTIPQGLLLRPAIPSSEVFGESSTYGPRANFKISIRELPQQGNFCVKVRASRYDDGLLLNSGSPPLNPSQATDAINIDLTQHLDSRLEITRAGVYQVDVAYALADAESATQNTTYPASRATPLNFSPHFWHLELGGRHFAGNLLPPESQEPSPAHSRTASADSHDLNLECQSALLLVELPSGSLPMSVRHGSQIRPCRITLSRVADDSAPANQFRTFAARSPWLGVHLGLRRDCGSTLKPVEQAREVRQKEPEEFVFVGAINDFPSPDVEPNNVNYLAGIREIGVRSEFTDGRDLPRLLIHAIEFEGPYYREWPPDTHTRIFEESFQRDDPPAYARELLRSFLRRAYRRPVTESEEKLVFNVWQESFAEHGSFRRSIKDALLVVLTSPQFLFLIENSSSPAPEDLSGYELAAKLSYFLWNTAPDEQLLQAAAAHSLPETLDSETDRMMRDARFQDFVQDFVSQWLSLDKFDVVEIDQTRYPRLTRDMRQHLRDEPIRFISYLIEQNLPLRNLLQCDFIIANDPVASYYDLADRAESGLRFVPIALQDVPGGGVLSQASILAGLSNGRESNPVKRGAWLARKIIAEPPADPPPNVPELQAEDGTERTLREKLELHRNQAGCVKCHAGIDPWGVPFEIYDAAGMLKPTAVDARSQLPDGTEVRDLHDLKRYLSTDRIDRVAFSFLKHLAAYATGRSLTYNDIVYLEQEGPRLRASGYRLQDLIRFIIHSDIFLKK